jgi:hypothetical protein
MIVVLKGDEPEGLQHSVRHPLHGAENFRHPVDRPGLRLKGNFDEVALCQRLRQSEQAAGHGNGLQFCFGAAAIFEANRSQDGISKLDPGRAPRGVRLGEVGHKQLHYGTMVVLRNRLLKPLVRIPAPEAAIGHL